MILNYPKRQPQQLVTHEEEWWEVFLFKEGKLLLIQIAGRLNTL